MEPRVGGGVGCGIPRGRGRAAQNAAFALGVYSPQLDLQPASELTGGGRKSLRLGGFVWGESTAVK